MWGAEVVLGKFVLFDSLKVSDSLLIYESPKWILRYAQYDGVVDCHENPCGFYRNDEKIIDS